MPITYTDKQVAVDPQNPVDPIEKWKADDANEVKNVVNAHIADTANPHGVTKSQVGLGSVPNLSFSGSNTGDQDLSGLQPIDSDLTAIAALTPADDDFMQRKSGAWSNRTVSQVKTDLAISNVDNTSDANKPVSTAQQTALDLKVNLALTEVSVTGAISLDATAYGKIHLLSGTSADYQVDLPTAVGNTGKRIIFKGVNALTKEITVAGISGQLINGIATIKISTHGSFTLVSDGANWDVFNEVGSWISFTPTWTGFSASPSGASSKYFLVGKICYCEIQGGSSGTSNSTATTVTIPFDAKQVQDCLCTAIIDNGVASTTIGRGRTQVASNVLLLYPSGSLGNWTSSGSKRAAFTLTYVIN